MRLQVLGLTIAALAPLAAAPAWAHHSFAMFDRNRTVTLVGTVKELQLMNPHSSVDIMAPNASGRPVVWSLEMNSIGMQQRAGWSAQSVAPGEKVTAKMYPLKDGSNGGQLSSLQKANGQILEVAPAGRGPAAPPKAP